MIHRRLLYAQLLCVILIAFAIRGLVPGVDINGGASDSIQIAISESAVLIAFFLSTWIIPFIMVFALFWDRQKIGTLFLLIGIEVAVIYAALLALLPAVS